MVFFLHFKLFFILILFIGMVILFDVDTEMEIQAFEMQSTGTYLRQSVRYLQK